MSFCLNRTCPRPQNPDNARFCQTCGTRLRLGDRYLAGNRLTSESGSTLRGIDLQTGDRVVFKQYAVGEKLATFRQDVARLNQLGEHPQIPNLLAYFERESQQYVVQEFVEGQSLLTELQATGTFSEKQVREVLQEVLPLLQFLHDRQVVHRDIKPANFLRRDHTLMLVDFGTAKHATKSALAKTGTVLGSAEYAAPEQLVGKAIPASDLYSLAVSCIQLLTGLAPFDLYNSAIGTWIWRSAAIDLSDNLADTLDRLLQNSASQRYQSANKVMQVLSISAFGATIVQSQPAPLPPQLWDCVRRISTKAPIAAIATQSNQLAAGDSQGTIHRWSLPNFEERSPLKNYTQPITALAFADDLLISSSLDGKILVWQDDRSQTLTIESAPVTAIALSPDRLRLVSGGRDRQLKLWDLAARKLLHTFDCEQPIESIAWANQSIACGFANGSIAIWHSETLESLRTLMPHTAAVEAIAISGDTLISSSWDRSLQVRHLHTGGLRQSLTGHLLPVVALAVQKNLCASGSHDSTIRLWRDGQLQDVLKGHAATVSAIAFHETGLLSGSQDSTIRLWQPIEN
ncbi:protein kinase [Microcoleus sp. FACHB-1515]|uniref:WD40 repeat domain-containing serine/threonine-protein kinase n=1 Tax=Cyanophyceae TaxID=3028117 RepID=UPI001685D1A1|nr:WD40 repeat domain-containing serine/threonine-protein kinase [Microcoleus sp. FACHB-1515]MBD2089773.1 protein kinase [Microcoleus sp. FACHB-1515]